MEQTEDLVKLAEICLSTAKTIKHYLASNGLPQMSFDQNAPASFPDATPEIQMTRMILRDAAIRLHDLVAGPEEPLTWACYNRVQEVSAFRYVQHFKIAEAVPLNKLISYQDLASVCGVDVYQLRTVTRQLMLSHVFREPQPDHIAHTAASKLFLNDGVGSFNYFQTEFTFPSAANVIEAIERWGHGAQEPTEAGFNLAHNTSKPMFQYFEADTESGQRFGKMLNHANNSPFLSNEHIANGFDWASLGDNATVVDVAGNMGYCSVPIAQSNPRAQIIVQDQPKVIERAMDPSATVISRDMQDRFTYMVRDLYGHQPVQHAGVYFLRWILHDYSDKYCVKILKPLVAAMKPNYSRLIISDFMLPPPGTVPTVIERFVRCQDMQMMTLFNAKEREYGEWIELFEKTDPRLKLKNVVTAMGSSLSFLEVILEEKGEKEMTLREKL